MSRAFIWWDQRVQVIFTVQYWKDLLLNVKNYTEDAVEHLIIACILYFSLCILLYLLITKNILRFNHSVQDPRRVLIVIAHPDDECMFFGPVIYNLVHQKECLIYLMCMSIGNGYGIGKERKNELYKSCKILGIDENCITLYNHSLMQDSMTENWPVELLANVILQQVETYNVDTLITFDKHGVSGHVNHCSIYYAVAHLKLEKRLPNYCRVYVLETVNIFRKYWFLLDVPLNFILSTYRYFLSSEGRAVVRKAMCMHKSQLVWYRRFYMLFSRYILINTLQQMDLSDIELDLVDD